MDLIWQIPTALVTFVAGFSFIQKLLLGGMKNDIRQLEEIERFPVIDAAGSKLVRKTFSSATGETTAWYEPAPPTPNPVPDSGIGNAHYPPQVGSKGTAGDSGVYRDRTVKDVYDEMTDEQKSVLHLIVEESLDKNNPSELDLVRFMFNTFTFDQKRIACYLFSCAFNDERKKLYSPGSGSIYFNMTLEEQAWIGEHMCNIKDYIAGKSTDSAVAEYFASQIDVTLEQIENAEYEERTYQDNLRYLTKPLYGSVESI